MVGNSGSIAARTMSAAGTGTDVGFDTVSVDSVNMKFLRDRSSKRRLKANITDWELTEDQFMAIKPRTFLVKHKYVDPETGVHMSTVLDNPRKRLPIPEGAMPVRMGGFIWEELAAVDLHLISEQGIAQDALMAATIAQVQRLTDRVASLEAELAAA